MRPVRFFAFFAFGWALPDMIQAKWMQASISLLIACAAFIWMLWKPVVSRSDSR